MADAGAHRDVCHNRERRLAFSRYSKSRLDLEKVVRALERDYHHFELEHTRATMDLRQELVGIEAGLTVKTDKKKERRQRLLEFERLRSKYALQSIENFLNTLQQDKDEKRNPSSESMDLPKYKKKRNRRISLHHPDLGSSTLLQGRTPHPPTAPHTHPDGRSHTDAHLKPSLSNQRQAVVEPSASKLLARRSQFQGSLCRIQDGRDKTSGQTLDRRMSSITTRLSSNSMSTKGSYTRRHNLCLMTEIKDTTGAAPSAMRKRKQSLLPMETFMQLLPSYQKKFKKVTIEPSEALKCRYLRLTESNIHDLKLRCHEVGVDPGIHAHMTQEQIDDFFQDETD